MTLPRLPLSPQGPEFSRLVYGTWRVLDDGATAQDLNRRLNHCADLGMTTIDTAEIYGLYEVEEALGKALALSPGLRDRLEIVTKAGIYVPNKYHPERRVGYYNASAARLEKSLEKSLKFLGTDHVDLFLVHRPDWLTSADDTAAGLNQLVSSGKILSAGVSNYSVTQYDLLNSRMEKPLVTNQVEFHLLHMDPIHDGVLDLCQKLKVRPMAWSPLGGGRLFDLKNEAAQRLAAEAAKLADKYDGATLEQLAYAWILAHPSLALPVIGTNKIERIESAAKAASITLEREDWYALWVAAKGHGVP
ncbi:MAG: aldo/keto reductase family oxidoreductase [Verrucomicrobium sp.]|nr:aldo/keto reductase [Verrucomicrobium sp.]